MGNIKVLKDNYVNIQGVAVKKLKVRAADFENLQSEGLKVEVEVEEVKAIEPEEVEEVKPEPVKEEKHEEEMPSYFSGYDSKEKEYNFDENELKERIAGNYKNLANFDKKEEKKSVVPKKPEITVEEFERLLNADILIMTDKQEMISKLYSEKQTKLNNAKLEQSKLTDIFQKLIKEEQVAKTQKESIEKRLTQMQKEELFPYLAQVSEEDNAIREAAGLLDEALKNYFNVNQVVLKELIAKIERLGNEKSRIDKSSEQVRGDIIRLSDELRKCIKDSTPLLKEMIKIDAQFKDAQKETDKVIKDEYEALVKEETVAPVMEEEPVMAPEPEIPTVVPNAFENFRKVTAVHGINDSVMGINDFFEGNMENKNNSERRVA